MKHYSDTDIPIIEQPVYNVPFGTKLPIRGSVGQLFFLQYAPRSGLYVWDNDMWCRVCLFNSIILEQVLNGLMRVNKISRDTNLIADDCGVILCDTMNEDGVPYDISIVLPPTSLCAGLKYEFKKIKAFGTVAVIGINEEETIDGSITPIIIDEQYGSLSLYTDGREWFILNK